MSQKFRLDKIGLINKNYNGIIVKSYMRYICVIKIWKWENMDLWKVPESADVEHILLAKIDVSTGRRLNPDERAAKQAVAAKVFAKARAGVDFAQLAKEYSEDLTTKNSGGKLQMIRGLADPKLATKVFAMRINRVEMVSTEFGHHIARVTKKIPAKTKKISEVFASFEKHGC
mgnify:CR=1 FL=1